MRRRHHAGGGKLLREELEGFVNMAAIVGMVMLIIGGVYVLDLIAGDP